MKSKSKPEMSVEEKKLKIDKDMSGKCGLMYDKV